jgi:hypothetical protein
MTDQTPLVITLTLPESDDETKPGLLFPALLEPEAEPTPQPQQSCAELVAARSQELLVNDWMSVATAQYIYKLLHRQPITSFATFVSSDGMSLRRVPIRWEELRTYLSE